MRVLIITGSRRGTKLVKELEDEIGDADLVIHGGAPGVDMIADEIARRRGVHVLRIDSLWEVYGNAAGPKRNSVVASLGAVYQKSGALVRYAAFPDARSVGTHDCVRKLTAHAISGKRYE